MSASPLSSSPLPIPGFSTSSPLPVPKHWNAAPFPAPPQETIPIGRLVLPAWPEPTESFTPPPQPLAAQMIEPLPPPPFAYGPAPIERPALTPVPSFQPEAESAPIELPHIEPAPVAPAPVFSATAPPLVEAAEPDFTDSDLREALTPILQQVIGATHQTIPLDEQLEPMLRATIRRALAEYSPGNRPFQPPGTFDRFIWRLQALFTSRTYEDILFEKTHRFQVEEVFLLDAATLALVSYASSNPARHASTRRIEGTVQRLAIQLRDENGQIRPGFKLPDERNVVTHEGSYITLLAVVRGRPSETAISDLAFSLDRIEERFRERFQVKGSPLLQVLQPFLEDCLLIQAPASAA